MVDAEPTPVYFHNASNITDNISAGDMTCTDIAVRVPDFADWLSVRLIIGICYALLWLLGVGGNCLVLYVVLRHRLDMSVRTVFLISLSCSDLLMAAFGLPTLAISMFTRVWVFPAVMCYGAASVQALCIFVSSFTLIAIAFDRYLLIAYPHQVIITYQRARFIIVCIWLSGVALATPMSVYMRLESGMKREYGYTCGYYCVEEWPHPYAKLVYGVAVTVVQFGCPIVYCSILYYRISLRITEQFERRRTTQLMTAETTGRSAQRRRRSNRMMASMVVTFVLAWFPFNFVNMVRDFDLIDYLMPAKAFTVTFIVCYLIAMTSIIWNPIIYSFFNQSFRHAAKQLIGRSALPNANRSASKASWL